MTALGQLANTLLCPSAGEYKGEKPLPNSHICSRLGLGLPRLLNGEKINHVVSKLLDLRYFALANKLLIIIINK